MVALVRQDLFSVKRSKCCFLAVTYIFQLTFFSVILYRIKLERIAILQSEVDELMAVMAHITEKIRTLTADYQDRIKMFRAIESKMIDARNSGKDMTK